MTKAVFFGICSLICMWASGYFAAKAKYVDKMTEYLTAVNRCTEALTVANDIIESGQYCVSVCVENFEKWGC